MYYLAYMCIDSTWHTISLQWDEIIMTYPRVEEVVSVLVLVKKIRHKKYDPSGKIEFTQQNVSNNF